MTLKEIIDEKNRRLETIPAEFQSNVEKLQRGIYNRITELIGELEVKNGQIVMSEANLLRVEMINEEMKKVLNGKEYISAVKEFVGEFEKQKAVNDEYFKKAFGSDFSQVGIANQLLKNSQKSAFELLAGAQAEQNFIAPIKSQLEQAVASGASYKDTITNIRETVEGTEDADGRLLKYSKQVTWDAFAVSDRAYTNAIAEDLDVEWYSYLGGVVEDSRCFCEERDGGYYHYKEIEAWGRGEDLGICEDDQGGWQGQMPGTNENTIFIVAGGYNCKHSIIPVSLISVPMDDIQRNIDNGNFVPSEFEKKELSL
jgi:hypothetical protein